MSLIHQQAEKRSCSIWRTSQTTGIDTVARRKNRSAPALQAGPTQNRRTFCRNLLQGHRGIDEQSQVSSDLARLSLGCEAGSRSLQRWSRCQILPRQQHACQHQTFQMAVLGTRTTRPSRPTAACSRTFSKIHRKAEGAAQCLIRKSDSGKTISQRRWCSSKHARKSCAKTTAADAGNGYVQQAAWFAYHQSSGTWCQSRSCQDCDDTRRM